MLRVARALYRLERMVVGGWRKWRDAPEIETPEEVYIKYVMWDLEEKRKAARPKPKGRPD